MAETLDLPTQLGGRSLFIEGYFSDLILRGDRPKYGYPTNHVPETTIEQMTVVTGYVAALKSQK